MQTAQTNQIKQSEVEEAIQAIKAYYDEGKAQLKLGKPYGAPGTASSKERLAKAKAIANPLTGYTPTEFSQLLAVCRRSRFVLTKAHLIKLVTVPKGPQRQALQNEILAERWSTIQLGLTLRARFGNRRPQAGRIRTMEDWDDAKSLIEKFAQQWERMHSALADKCEQSRQHNQTDNFSTNLSPAVKKRLLAVDKALQALRATLQ